MAGQSIWLDGQGRVLMNSNGAPFYTDTCCCGQGPEPQEGWCCRHGNMTCSGALPTLPYTVPVVVGARTDQPNSRDPVWEAAGTVPASATLLAAPASLLGEWRAFRCVDAREVQCVELTFIEGRHPADEDRARRALTARSYVQVQDASLRYLPVDEGSDSFAAWCTVNGDGTVTACWATLLAESADAQTLTWLSYVFGEGEWHLDTVEVGGDTPLCSLFQGNAFEHGIIKIERTSVEPYEWRDLVVPHVGCRALHGCMPYRVCDDVSAGRDESSSDPAHGNYVRWMSPGFEYVASASTAFQHTDSQLYEDAAHGTGLLNALYPRTSVSMEMRWKVTVCSGLYYIASVARAKTCTQDTDARVERMPFGIPVPPQPPECALPSYMWTKMLVNTCQTASQGWSGQYPVVAQGAPGTGHFKVTGVHEEQDDPLDPERVVEVADISATGLGDRMYMSLHIEGLTYGYYGSWFNRCPPVPYPVDAVDPLRLCVAARCNTAGSGTTRPTDDRSDSIACDRSCSACASDSFPALPCVPVQGNPVPAKCIDMADLLHGVGNHPEGYVIKCHVFPMSAVDASDSASTVEYCADLSGLAALVCCPWSNGGLRAGWVRWDWTECTFTDTDGQTRTVRYLSGETPVTCAEYALSFDTDGHPVLCDRTGQNVTATFPAQLCCTLPKDRSRIKKPPATYLYSQFDMVCGDWGIPVSGEPTSQDLDDQLLYGRDKEDTDDTGASSVIPECSTVSVSFAYEFKLEETNNSDEIAPVEEHSSTIYDDDDEPEGTHRASCGRTASRHLSQSITKTCSGSFSFKVPSQLSIGAGWTYIPVPTPGSQVCGETAGTAPVLHVEVEASLDYRNETTTALAAGVSYYDPGSPYMPWSSSEQSQDITEVSGNVSRTVDLTVAGVYVHKKPRTYSGNQYVPMIGDSAYTLEAVLAFAGRSYVSPSSESPSPDANINIVPVDDTFTGSKRHHRSWTRTQGGSTTSGEESSSEAVSMGFPGVAQDDGYGYLDYYGELEIDYPQGAGDPVGGMTWGDYIYPDGKADPSQGRQMCSGEQFSRPDMLGYLDEEIESSGPLQGCTRVWGEPVSQSYSGNRSGGSMLWDSYAGYDMHRGNVHGSYSYSLTYKRITETCVTITRAETQAGQ